MKNNPACKELSAHADISSSGARGKHFGLSLHLLYYINPLCMRAEKALARLCLCASLSEPRLLVDAWSTKISCVDSFQGFFFAILGRGPRTFQIGKI